MPAGILPPADRGQVPDQWVTGGHLPPGVEQTDQCDSGWQVFQSGAVERGGDLCGDPLDDGVEQRFASREVGVDGLPADTGGPGDVFDAGPGVLVQDLGCGLQDRSDAVPGFGPLPSAPGLRLC